MGAPDLLQHLRAAGFDVALTNDRRVSIAPARALTDAQREAIRAHRDDLVALLAKRETSASSPIAATPVHPPRLHALARAKADETHRVAWGDDVIARFIARRDRLKRWGYADADDLAERLALRDQDADDRRLCIECRNCRPGLRCSASQRSGFGPDLGRDLATRLHRCPAFACLDIDTARN